MTVRGIDGTYGRVHDFFLPERPVIISRDLLEKIWATDQLTLEQFLSRNPDIIIDDGEGNLSVRRSSKKSTTPSFPRREPFQKDTFMMARQPNEIDKWLGPIF